VLRVFRGQSLFSPEQSGRLFAIFAVTVLKRRDGAVYVIAASIDDPFVSNGHFIDIEPDGRYLPMGDSPAAARSWW
jgi:hypothetical protein